MSNLNAIIDRLREGNERYLLNEKHSGDISSARKVDTATSGQHPFALVVTCSDSRVPAELIFDVGVGDLFVIRTAGNVIGEYELGSIEYAVAHLGIEVVVILGHSGCGAVSSALSEDNIDEENLAKLVKEIKVGIGSESKSDNAENLNIAHSSKALSKSSLLKQKLDNHDLTIVEAKYDIKNGKVTFF